jgi:hypothetical protein
VVALDQANARGTAPEPWRHRLRNREMKWQSRERAATAHEARAPTDPPFVIDVFGEVAPNGQAIGLRVERSRQGPVDLCLRTEDVQFMVSMLLNLSCEAKRRQTPCESEGPPREAVPLPLTAINVGLDDRDQTFLMLEVGTAVMMFGLSADAVAAVGQTLLALSARSSGQPS